jgi:hypothetical protein
MAPGPLHRLARACVAAAVLASAAGCAGSSEVARTDAADARSTTSTGHRVAAADLEKRVQTFLDLDYTGSFDHIRAASVSPLG